ncbi:MAG: 2-hydroxyacid dehydrogenase [Phycisphaerae bacterium]
MKVAVFSTKPYDRRFLSAANQQAGGPHEFVFFEPRLTAETAVLASGFPAVCAFVNDDIAARTLQNLSAGGTRFLAMRSAGFNNVDVTEAKRLRITVARVPAYSPHGVAEHAVALMLALNRRLHKSYNRVREGNFSLEGLLGFEMRGRTAGVVGTGKIGAAVAHILLGLGMRVLAFDVHQDEQLVRAGVIYTELDALLTESDIITLHVPLMAQTHHLIDHRAIGRMRRGAMLINTSRGGLVDTAAVINGLKDGHIGALGLDVYEEEEVLFFEDHSARAIPDDVFARLLTFPNVIVTGHQAFFTQEALSNIAATTVENLTQLERTGSCENSVV